MTGRTVAHYKLLEKLGEGGMGSVYKGVDLMIDRPVAIKVLHPQIARQADVVERFRQEAALLARLNHPAIATLYSFFRDGDDLLMVMEFVQGRTLAVVLREQGPLTIERAKELLINILDGVEHAHQLGVLHRDLKPANLLINERGLVKITDFGIARALGSDRLTREARVVGTLEYLAPERVRGEEGDARSDIYSLGAIFYEMLTNRIPFERHSDFDLMSAHLEELPAPVRRWIPSLPGALEQIVFRALEKKAEDRFQTASDFSAAIRAVTANAPPAPEPEVKATRFADAAPIPETKFVGAPFVAKAIPARQAKTAGWMRHPATWLGLAAAAVLMIFLFAMERPSRQEPVSTVPKPASNFTEHNAAALSPVATDTGTPTTVPAPVIVPPESTPKEAATAPAPKPASQSRANRRAAALAALDQ